MKRMVVKRLLFDEDNSDIRFKESRTSFVFCKEKRALDLPSLVVF